MKSTTCYTCNSNRVLVQKQPPATKLSLPKNMNGEKSARQKPKLQKINSTKRSQFVIHASSLHKIQKAFEAALNFWPCSNALHDFIPLINEFPRKHSPLACS